MSDTSATERLPRTMARIEDDRAAGQHLGAQLYVSRHGRPIAEIALGEAAPGMPMTVDVLMPWLSAGKPMMAVAVMQLVEQHRLGLDDSVVDHLPQFAGGGKEAITLRHLLTHTAGLVPVALPASTPREEILAEICRSELPDDWQPGQRARYDPSAGWYVLGAVVERQVGEPIDLYARREILEPLAMADCWLSLSREQLATYGNRVGQLFNTQRRGEPPVLAEPREAALHLAPGKSARGPMRQLGRFYEALLPLLNRSEQNGESWLTPDSAHQMVQRQRHGIYDETFRHTIDWGLGFLLDTKQQPGEVVPYGYGPRASPGTFGHSGSQSSAAFADPAHGLVVAVAFNGMCGEPRHQRRIHALLGALYDDLGM